MKAYVYDRYGPPEVLRQVELPDPVPGPREVLVRVHAFTVSSGDARMRASRFPPLYWLPARLFFGLTAPRNRVLGFDFSGTVAATGSEVTRYAVGDAVFGAQLFGGNAELRTLPEDGKMAGKPANLTHEEAAAIPFGATTALYFLRKAGVGPGQKVLVVGAAGAVGSSAVQLARHFGAEVTGVCSAGKHGLVRGLGAQHVIDYAAEDFTRNGQTYDIIFDTVGATTVRGCRDSLTPNGRHVFLVTGASEIFHSLRTARGRGRKVIGGVDESSAEDMATLSSLAEEGALQPVIDSRFPFEQLAEAHARVDTGHKTGSVVVSVPLPS